MLLLCSVLGAPKRIDSYFTQLEPQTRAALPPSAAPPLPDDFTYALPLGINDNHSWLDMPAIQMAFPSLQKPRRHANLSARAPVPVPPRRALARACPRYCAQVRPMSSTSSSASDSWRVSETLTGDSSAADYILWLLIPSIQKNY